jgi:putative toxin-antitoxin system antitoxin component (TIGR02293 family)
MATVGRRATTKAKQKIYLRREAGKALTSTAGTTRTQLIATGIKRYDYAKQIGLKVKTPVDLVKQVEKGLAFTAVEALQQEMDLATKEMAKLLDIKVRTLLRRKEAGRLQPAESDRVVRTSRLFARAKDLFAGNQEAARGWLTNPQRALGGAVPLEIAKTEVGAREVENIIGRLEQGVFT